MALSLPEFRLSTYISQMRYRDRPDLFLVAMPETTCCSGVFTQSSLRAAPVLWDVQRLNEQSSMRALLVNAGYANAMTGEEGMRACQESAILVSQVLDIKAEEVMLASTGVIGPQLELQSFKEHLKPVHTPLDEDSLHEAARAMMTTDTFAKTASSQVSLNGSEITIMGMAKGSGMIAPNMATMLAFIFCNVCIDPVLWQKAAHDLAASTFNTLSVDSDTSTNDTLLLFTSQSAQNKRIDKQSYPQLLKGLCKVGLELVQDLARDGEGATKKIHITVTGARDKTMANHIAADVANSPLVKTALAANDANWGRIAMAIGKSGYPLQPQLISLTINDFPVIDDGVVSPHFDDKRVSASLNRDTVTIMINLNQGQESAERWTCDLTEAYIQINGSYRS